MAPEIGGVGRKAAAGDRLFGVSADGSVFFAAQRQWLLRGILVPAAGFLLVTELRSVINAPRPYEALEIPSVTPKDTKGKSFPSRHAACGAVIAGTALFTVPVIGGPLLVISLLIAVSRVRLGVILSRM